MAERDDVTTGAADAQAAVPGSAAQALARHEAEKMSRRAVLAKVGLRFGAAVIAAISVDDLTRAVTASIARSNKDNVVAQQVANEFKNAGVAFADVSASGACFDDPCNGSCWADWIKNHDGTHDPIKDACAKRCNAFCSGSTVANEACKNDCEAYY